MKHERAAVVSVRGLEVRRGAKRILDAVDWEVREGEHWAILGANGSGKTSLLSALTGYLTPTAGEIWMLGQRFGAADWRELRTRVGLVGSAIRQLMPEEEPALTTVISGKYATINHWKTVEEPDRVLARGLLRLMQVAELADRPWGVLSQGERQRVLIARALMARPKLLILDEPCAGLDPVARRRFLELIERLARQRDAPTLVLVTHHVEEITPAFSHALLLLEGKALAAGARKTVLTSARLSEALGAPVRLQRSRSGEYRLLL